MGSRWRSLSRGGTDLTTETAEDCAETSVWGQRSATVEEVGRKTRELGHRDHLLKPLTPR